MNVELYFGSNHVGQIEAAFWSDNTGFGMFRPTLRGAAAITQRIRHFIAFSEGWHEALKGPNPRDAAEFDSFSDIYGSNEWRVVASDGTVTPIDVPAFIDGEITWRPSEKN